MSSQSSLAPLRCARRAAIDVEPDASALEADFYVGTRSQLSNTTIVNGQISRSRTWTYVMMAKREGDLVIPPVRIGSEQSEPVPIRVMPPSTNLPSTRPIMSRVWLNRCSPPDAGADVPMNVMALSRTGPSPPTPA